MRKEIALFIDDKVSTTLARFQVALVTEQSIGVLYRDNTESGFRCKNSFWTGSLLP